MATKIVKPGIDPHLLNRKRPIRVVSYPNESMFMTNEPNGKWKVSRFRPTPILASYLLALFVSEYEYEETYTNRGVRFRVWSTPKTKRRRAYGLKGATIYMEFFEEYFGVQDIVTKQGRLHMACYHLQ
ncbi:hypothetical protein ANCCAN_04643 [Ancylostoma caninum]|uniref:Uncharacterized protein n=1 Tax=Ancylostoma caninum TaxID=29170 RepID=A0A368H0A6_ANCCA|nr:hypothetical protein ANCCAN_04643 [Ancylostoma caninum]